MTSMKDVAELAGVSSATVSRVLRNRPNVRPEMRERVMAAVRELNYRPNRVARSLRVQQSTIIGLAVTDIVEGSFFTGVARAVEDVAFKHQYALFLCSTDETPERERLYLELMRAEHVAGVIIAPTRDVDVRLAPLFEDKIPVVAVDRRVEQYEVDTVLSDNLDATHKLVSHLLEHGYRRIGAIAGIPTITTGRERLEGYRRALAAYDIPFDSRLVFSVVPREANAYEAMKALWKRKPDAVFTSTEVLTAGALRAMQELGLDVPGDVALAGFDDPFWSNLVRPHLTCVRQPTYEMGQLAADLLIERLHTPTRPTREVVLKSKFIVRESCGCHDGAENLEEANNAELSTAND